MSARCVDLLADLHAGLADGTYARRLKAWARPDLLVIDDVGLGQVRQRDDEPTAAHTLFNLVDRRHGKLSTAVTKARPGTVARWNAEQSFAVAFADG